MLIIFSVFKAESLSFSLLPWQQDKFKVKSPQQVGKLILLHFLWFCWLAEAPRCRAAHSGGEVVSGVVCPCIAHALHLLEVSSKSRAVQGWCSWCTLLWAEHSRLQQTPGFGNLLGIKGQGFVFTWGDQNPAQSATPGVMSTNLQFCIWLRRFYV